MELLSPLGPLSNHRGYRTINTRDSLSPLPMESPRKSPEVCKYYRVLLPGCPNWPGSAGLSPKVRPTLRGLDEALRWPLLHSNDGRNSKSPGGNPEGSGEEWSECLGRSEIN